MVQVGVVWTLTGLFGTFQVQISLPCDIVRSCSCSKGRILGFKMCRIDTILVIILVSGTEKCDKKWGPFS